MLRAPTARQLAQPATHRFLSSTGEWYDCVVIDARLILIVDPTYPLTGISKYCRGTFRDDRLITI